jgi:hypothetical protein
MVHIIAYNIRITFLPAGSTSLRRQRRIFCIRKAEKVLSTMFRSSLTTRENFFLPIDMRIWHTRMDMKSIRICFGVSKQKYHRVRRRKMGKYLGTLVAVLVLFVGICVGLLLNILDANSEPLVPTQNIAKANTIIGQIQSENGKQTVSPKKPDCLPVEDNDSISEIVSKINDQDPPNTYGYWAIIGVYQDGQLHTMRYLDALITSKVVIKVGDTVCAADYIESYQ